MDGVESGGKDAGVSSPGCYLPFGASKSGTAFLQRGWWSHRQGLADDTAPAAPEGPYGFLHRLSGLRLP